MHVFESLFCDIAKFLNTIILFLFIKFCTEALKLHTLVKLKAAVPFGPHLIQITGPMIQSNFALLLTVLENSY